MSGTRRLLLRLWIALLAATLLTVAGAVTAIDLGRRDAEALRSGEAPAREGLAAARESLITADNEAIGRFADDFLAEGGPGRGDGPGDNHRFAVDAVNRQIAQVSQADIGAAAAEAVQVVIGLLDTYTQLINQAFRDGAGEELSQAHLQYAHKFLREELLPQLDTLQGEIDRAAPDRPGTGRNLLWVLPLIVLAGLLAWTQVELSRRFRRTLSIPLLAASAAVATLGVIATLSLAADRQVADGRATLAGLTSAYVERQAAVNEAGCDDRQVVARIWSDPETGCDTAEQAGTATNQQLLGMANEVTTTAQEAAATARAGIVTVVLLGAVAGLLISLGMLPRLEEYRFRRR